MKKETPAKAEADPAPTRASEAPAPIAVPPPGGGSWIRHDDGTLTKNKD